MYSVTIFRPTRGGAVDIDVSLVTQLLDPILKQRTEDNSIALDSLGEVEAKIHNTPSEIIMLCVDCSTSMTSTAGFEDLNEDEESYEDDDEKQDDANEDWDASGRIENDLAMNQADLHKEALSILATHENLPQILAIIREKNFRFAKEDVASKALEVIVSLYKAELEHFKEQRSQQETRFSSRYLQSAAYTHGNPTVLRINKLVTILRPLTKANRADLVRYLIDQAPRDTSMSSKAAASQHEVSKKSTMDPESATVLEVPHVCPLVRKIKIFEYCTMNKLIMT